mgnify:CR=1 FL=1
MENVNLLLTDARGIYIPRDFVEGYDLSKFTGISEDDIETCKNPDSEWYWESWNMILSNARFTAEDGRIFYLSQDGDLWLLCYDQMNKEEKRNFGMED